jgi:formylglycine-generating enzyme
MRLAQFDNAVKWSALFFFTVSLAFGQETKKPGTPAPTGMVWIPGGEFAMGAATNGRGQEEMPMASNDAEPVHQVYVDPFWIDTTAVTNEQFEKFVNATQYITIAERIPTKEEFPDAPEEIWSPAV